MVSANRASEIAIALLPTSIERFGPDHSATFRANKRRLRNDADDENQPTSHFVPDESRSGRKREVNLPADFASALALLQHLRCD
ncbi:MAG: hypothetical protein JOY90_19830 [Bradyrhizobium sp.]|nr:hypothetical protein [Bradyrhizobium sp.]